ncbi:hypothetical protein BASA81_003668 [Batrachochytrium salamandrivorans]|nr:hypothetical protein BASA81_003668 [Batrachochytrium salamandrivorans]
MEDDAFGQWMEAHPPFDLFPLFPKFKSRPRRLVRLRQQHHQPTAEVRSVVSSKKLRAQFLIELVMRFSALKGLKDLDHSIDVKDLVFGHKLGGGAFGTVYQAKLRGMPVAVKQLKGLQTNEAILNLKIEVEILARLRHPHILLYIGMAQTQSFSAMITEWCELGSLNDLLRDFSTPLPAKQVLKFALEVAEGMWYLHSMEKLLIIHRDIKSANILVTSNFKLKIADFGLAVMNVRDLEMASELQVDYHGYCGTPQFMAPEVLRKNEMYGQKCDVYSFGVLLTELVTRRMPWLDRYQHLDFIKPMIEDKQRPTIPRYLSSGQLRAASELGDVIKRCLNEQPENRPMFCDVITQLEHIYTLVETDDLYQFSNFEIPRYLEALGPTSLLEDLELVAGELLQVLQATTPSSTSTVVSEKAQVLQIVADEFMQLLLQRLGSGKSLQIVQPLGGAVENMGGEVEVVDLGNDVLETLVCCLKLLSELVGRRLPQVLPVDQLQAVVDLFFGLEDSGSNGLLACADLLQQLCHCNAEFRKSLEDFTLGDTSKLQRCNKYHVLLLQPRNQAQLDISTLEAEVEEMEHNLFAKKKRLMELKFNTKLVLLKRRLSTIALEDPLSLMPPGALAAALLTPKFELKKQLT